MLTFDRKNPDLISRLRRADPECDFHGFVVLIPNGIFTASPCRFQM
jgi:hypothetical protein